MSTFAKKLELEIIHLLLIVTTKNPNNTEKHEAGFIFKIDEPGDFCLTKFEQMSIHRMVKILSLRQLYLHGPDRVALLLFGCDNVFLLSNYYSIIILTKD